MEGVTSSVRQWPLQLQSLVGPLTNSLNATERRAHFKTHWNCNILVSGNPPSCTSRHAVMYTYRPYHA